MLTAVALVGALAAAAEAQESPRIVLTDVEVTVSEDQRLVLYVSDGRTYELAGLRARHECEGATGRWECGEASRRLLQGAVNGENLECVVLGGGDRPTVECMAQTRNLNLWMLRRAGIELLPEWRAAREYAEAEQARRTARELTEAVAAIDPLNIRSRRPRSDRDASFADTVRDDDQRKTVPLGDRAGRRGATAAERHVIADDAPGSNPRAGVWELDGLRVIVGEDLEGCLQYIWCSFAVVDETGEVVLTGTARGAPRLEPSEGLTLVWQDPGGVEKRWTR